MSRSGSIVALVLLGAIACKSSTEASGEGSGRARAEVEPAAPEPDRVEPGRPGPDAAEPDEATSPEAKLALQITLTRTSDAYAPYEFTAEPQPQARPLEGLVVNDCAAKVPCGWASLCEELALRWARQLGLHELRSELAAREYSEAECGDEPPPSDSGDFVAHAAVIQNSLDVLHRDRIAGLLARTSSGWKGLARIEEQVIEGMSSQRVQVPRASWQLELDEHPGKELVVLTTGYDLLARDDDSGFAWVIVCRARPEPSCRRVAMRKAKRLEIYDDGRFVVDAEAARRFDQLDRADQLLKQ